MSIKQVTKGWRVYIKPGGRAGRQLRRTFLLKADAVTWERQLRLDTERLSLSIPSSILVTTLIDEFEKRYAAVRFMGYHEEKYRIKVIRKFYEFRNKEIGKFTLRDAEEFILFRTSEGNKPATINRDINTLKRIFSWAFENNYLPFDPLAKKLRHIKGAVSRVRWLTSDEIKKLLSATKSDTTKQAIIIALNTGFRKGNLERLQWADVSNEFITAVKTKSGKPYDVPINETLKDFLTTIPKTDGRILNMVNFGIKFRAIVKRAGLWTGASDPNKVTPHTLRHTFAAHCLQAGVPIYTVSKWMGHSSTKMTETVYGHLSKSHHTEEIKKIQGVGV